MLELVVLYFAGRHIASLANTKNRSGIGYVFLMVAAAFAGATVGCVSGVVAGQVLEMGSEEDILPVVIGFYVGLLMGVGLGYLVVALVPARYDGADYDDYQMEEWSLHGKNFNHG